MRRQVRSPEVVVIAIQLRHILLVLAAMILPLGALSLAQSVSASLSPAQSVGPSVLFPAETVGPSWPYEKVLNGQHPVIPLKNQAMITRTEHGYLYRAGQQDSHFVITRVESGLRFRDSGTREWKSIPDACRREQVAAGVAAVCPVPSSIGLSNPMLLEVWPRLGDDFVDGSTLPGPFQMAVLADAGRDVVLLGAGHDFVNGAMDNDVVRGGGGDDWIRTGIGDDDIAGGPGGDKLVGTDGHDSVRGGDGSDSVYGGAGDDIVRGGDGNDSVYGGAGDDRTVRGGDGNDSVYGGAGDDRLYADDSAADVVSCGSGRDTAQVDRTDRVRDCETLARP